MAFGGSGGGVKRRRHSIHIGICILNNNLCRDILDRVALGGENEVSADSECARKHIKENDQ